MVRSRSRSPRWRNRSLSPTYRSPERHRQRHFQDHYDSEFKGFRKDPRKPMHWREEDRRYGQNNLRSVPPGNMHPRIYDYSPSPKLRTPTLEDPHRNNSQRNYQPERDEINERYSYRPKYPEVVGYRERERPFYQDNMHGRNMREEPRVPRDDKRVKPFHGLDASFSKHEGELPEGDLKHQRLQTDKYSYSPRRSSEEFAGRSSYQKRYPEERDFRDFGPAAKRARGDTERYENREPVRNSHWKPDHPLPPRQDKETSRDVAARAFRSSEQDYPEASSVSKVAFDYSHKPHRYADDETVISDGRALRHSRQEERKYSPAKSQIRSKDKEHDGVSGHSVLAPEGHNQAPLKYSSEKSHSTRPADVCKDDVDLRPLSNKLKERVRKQGDSQKTPGGLGNQRDKSQKPPDLKTSSSNTSDKTESLMVKVDMKKMMDKYRITASPSAERQMSNDLVAVSKKKEDFHPVFEHIDSAAPDLKNDLKREFTQEIITIIHEVKANYFKPSALTLHERFSKMQQEKDANENKTAENSNPEIHRRIDISLADLKSKRVKRSESVQTGAKVISDPHDLRHDIERRRKERLRSEDGTVFDSDIADRNDLSSSFASLPKPKTEFEKTSKFMRAPFRKFVGRSHSSFSHGGNSDYFYAHKRQLGEDFDHPRTSMRPFKDNFTESRIRYKSGLVRKGLHIQAKYQWLRSHADGRGFTTNKSRDSFLRKREEYGNTGSEI